MVHFFAPRSPCRPHTGVVTCHGQNVKNHDQVRPETNCKLFREGRGNMGNLQSQCQEAARVEELPSHSVSGGGGEKEVGGSELGESQGLRSLLWTFTQICSVGRTPF